MPGFICGVACMENLGQWQFFLNIPQALNVEINKKIKTSLKKDFILIWYIFMFK